MKKADAIGSADAASTTATVMQQPATVPPIASSKLPQSSSIAAARPRKSAAAAKTAAQTTRRKTTTSASKDLIRRILRDENVTHADVVMVGTMLCSENHVPQAIRIVQLFESRLSRQPAFDRAMLRRPILRHFAELESIPQNQTKFVLAIVADIDELKHVRDELSDIVCSLFRTAQRRALLNSQKQQQQQQQQSATDSTTTTTTTSATSTSLSDYSSSKSTSDIRMNVYPLLSVESSKISFG